MLRNRQAYYSATAGYRQGSVKSSSKSHSHTVCLRRSRNFNSTIFLLLCHLGCLFMELAILIQDFSVGISEARCVTLNTFSNSASWSWESCQPLRNQLIPWWHLLPSSWSSHQTKIKGLHFLIQELVLGLFQQLKRILSQTVLYSNICCKNVYIVALIIECYIY